MLTCGAPVFPVVPARTKHVSAATAIGRHLGVNHGPKVAQTTPPDPAGIAELSGHARRVAETRASLRSNPARSERRIRGVVVITADACDCTVGASMLAEGSYVTGGLLVPVYHDAFATPRHHSPVDLHELGKPRVQHLDLACSRFGFLAVDNPAVHPGGCASGWHHFLGMAVRRARLALGLRQPRADIRQPQPGTVDVSTTVRYVKRAGRDQTYT